MNSGMLPLPPIDQLIQRCRALAALDLMLSPDWQYRFYSFNSRWSEDEQMASMRNGCGDEWWIIFHRDGWAALKGLGHESAAWSRHRGKLSSALQQSFPAAMAGFSTEPAFCWDATSFAYFHPAGAPAWIRANDLTAFAGEEETGEVEFLAHLHGSPADYAAFATDYYETEVDERIVADIFALRPISATVVSSLNPNVSLSEISEELFEEIQYPRPNQRL